MRLPAQSLTALLLAGCQAAPNSPLRAPRPLPPEVFQRFELDDPVEPFALEPIHVLGVSVEADAEGVDAPAASIELNDVLESVERHFPLILAAREELAAAEGALLAAEGGFDTQLAARAGTDLEGFYRTDRLDFGVRQPTALWGLDVEGGYRLGSGDFAVYDGGDETNDGGEFRLGLNIPLLQGRAVDPRRIELWRARLERDRAEPFLLERRLLVTRDAAEAYWRWLAAGRVREIAVRLLALAEDRAEQIQVAVDEGQLAPINLVENRRLIVDRQAEQVRAERRLQETAIALSLYWRDAEGRPAVPLDGLLPYEFPAPRDVATVLVPGDEALALEQRPEVRAVELRLEQARLELGLAENELLPRLDLNLRASQDVGAAASVPDDKEEFALGAVLSFDVPFQRRTARGDARRLAARLEQLRQEARLVRDVVVTDVQDARSALVQSWQRIGQARENVRLASELADAERFQLEAGESDLLRVNLREQQAAVAAADLVEVLEEYFRAHTAYRAVLGVPHGS